MRTVPVILRLGFLLVAFAVCFILGSTPTAANPLFARRYNTSCFSCHTSPPLLNELGRRFQANGYVLPETSENHAQASGGALPIGLIAQPMISHTQVRDNKLDSTTENSTAFTGIMVRLFSSGSLGPHFTYYAGVPVTVANGETSVEIETAHIIYRDVLGDASGALNFRLGKFLLLVPYTPMFLLSGQDPLVYNSMFYSPIDGKTVANDLNISEPMFGASAYGTLYDVGEGLRWEAALVGGNKSDVSINSTRAFFGALDQTIFVEEAPVRFGGFVMSGAQDVSNSASVDTSSMAGMPGMGGGTAEAVPGSWKNHVTRYGFDAEVTEPWSNRFTLFAQYMNGLDDNIDSLGGEYKMTGGMVGINAVVLPEKLFAYARYDRMVSNRAIDLRQAVDVGLRYHPLPNVIVTAGLTITKEKLPGAMIDQTTTALTGGLLFGF